MAGYLDPRYYAGMLKLAPRAYEAEKQHVGDHNRAAYEKGRTLAEQPDFSASFDDPEYGRSWWHHAKFHGHV